jgi:predicted DNA-binding protein (MmcQ/YjbR family)
MLRVVANRHPSIEEIAMSDETERADEMVDALRAARAMLRTFALELPGAYEDFPWGESVVKVNKKVFVFLGMDVQPGAGFSFSVKLPISGNDVLALPFAVPTGYGLGKSGWVTLRFLPGDQPPIGTLRAWVEESYRVIAPRRLIAQLEGRAAGS